MEASLTESDRLEMGHAMMQLFDKWRVSAPQRITLLGLPENTKARFLNRYREDTPLPDSEEIAKRVECFLDIDKALFTSFPHNPAMGQVWLTTPNQRFDKHTPLDVMLEEGLEGMYKIRSHLDCTYNWV
jgi:hypothetical protein